MKRAQIILVSVGLLLFIGLLFFGKTVNPNKQITAAKPTSAQTTILFADILSTSKEKLTAEQNARLTSLENSVVRGDVQNQKIHVYHELATFWKDSAKAFEPYAYYTAEAAKLDNSEKNLTFAAQLILANLRSEQDEAKLNWETEQAIGLFEQALKLNPTSADLKIGLGSCYIFGKGRFGGAAETMQGVQKVLEVVRTDSMNMKAQLVLGIGGYISGQYDKAIERLTKVITTEPQNLEAIAFLADTYAAKGDKQEAIKWYQLSKRMSNDPHYTEEVDQRIKELK